MGGCAEYAGPVACSAVDGVQAGADELFPWLGAGGLLQELAGPVAGRW